MKIYLFLMCFVLMSCMTERVSVKNGIKEIRFGGGGGFTGEVKTYILTSESRLLENEKEIKKIDSKETIEIYNKAKLLEDYVFNEPDNLYSFIEIKTNDKTNRIVWSFGSTKIDKRVIELYTILYQPLKKSGYAK